MKHVSDIFHQVQENPTDLFSVEGVDPWSLKQNLLSKPFDNYLETSKTLNNGFISKREQEKNIIMVLHFM